MKHWIGSTHDEQTVSYIKYSIIQGGFVLYTDQQLSIYNISGYETVVFLLGNTYCIIIWIYNKASILEAFKESKTFVYINYLIKSIDHGFIFYYLRNDINKLLYTISAPLFLIFKQG